MITILNRGNSANILPQFLKQLRCNGGMPSSYENHKNVEAGDRTHVKNTLPLSFTITEG